MQVALVWALGHGAAVRAGPARVADADAVVAVTLAVAAGWTGKLRHEGVGLSGTGRSGQHEPVPHAGSRPHAHPGNRRQGLESRLLCGRKAQTGKHRGLDCGRKLNLVNLG